MLCSSTHLSQLDSQVEHSSIPLIFRFRVWQLSWNMSKMLLVIQRPGLPVSVKVNTVTHLSLKMQRLQTDSLNADSFHMGFWEKSTQVPGKRITNVWLHILKYARTVCAISVCYFNNHPKFCSPSCFWSQNFFTLKRHHSDVGCNNQHHAAIMLIN